ncbi:MAG: outer membrane beta-barrel protein [Bacteroidetes bacterium]|nr:outer membrane beta-barrel protein [Bacteroidota bacterium]
MKGRRCGFGLTICAVVVFQLANAQTTDSTKGWDYGINANFNVSFVKPKSADSLTNKAGFGAGLMLERHWNHSAVQFSPNYARTSYFNDNTLSTFVINSLDFSMDFLYTANPKSSIYFIGGLTPSYTFGKYENLLDGSKNSGLTGIALKNETKFDVALKIGLALELTKGCRFTASYYEFTGNKYSKDKITGRSDYFQFGLQLRFNDLSSNRSVVEEIVKNDSIMLAANEHIQNIRNGATMVFVLPNLKSLNKSVGKNQEEINEQREEIYSFIRQSINSFYTIGPFKIIKENELNSLLKVNQGDSAKNLYVAKIGEFFFGSNSRTSWGIAVFDSDMNLLQDPFPYFTPYRNIDTIFKYESSVAKMIQELNSSLR